MLLGRSFHRAVIIGALCVSVSVGFSPSSAYAKCYPCEVECLPAAPSAWGGALGAVQSAVESMGSMIAIKTNGLVTLLGLHASGRTTAVQSVNNTQLSLADMEVNNQTALAATKVRSDLIKANTPSMQACALTTSGAKVLDSEAKVGSRVKAAEGKMAALTGNATGTAGEKGELAFAASRFVERKDKYCDPKEITGCTPSISANADLDPTPVFSQAVLSGDQLTAANDMVKNLIGPAAVDDPVRGPALASSSGQAAFVLNSGKAARVNFVASAMSDIVESHADDGDGASAQSQLEALARVDESTAFQDALDSQGQNEQQAAAEVDAAMEAISNQLLQLRATFEKIALIRAVGMATDIQVNKKIQASAVGFKGN